MKSIIIYGKECTLDFSKMECKYDGKAYNLFCCGKFLPYKRVPKFERNITTGGRALHRFDPTKIICRWLWWDGDGADATYDGFIAGRMEPKWSFYSRDDEEKLEELFKEHGTTQGTHNINERYNVSFEDYMFQINRRDISRIRPVIRATYCWCWDTSNGKEDPSWAPHERDVSECLEEAFISGIPEVDIEFEGKKHFVNFSQGIQFCASDTSKKKKITRFGTEIADLCVPKIFCGYQELTNIIPKYWVLDYSSSSSSSISTSREIRSTDFEGLFSSPNSFAPNFTPSTLFIYLFIFKYFHCRYCHYV